MPDVANLSPAVKVEEAMRRSLKYVGPEARAELEQMLSPASIGILAGTIVLWAGSHFFGVGEFVDLILLVVGVFALGLGVIEGARELYRFATGAVDASSEADLESAGRHFARAVDILGITVVSAVLTKGAAKRVIARGRPVYRGLPKVGPPPPAGAKPTVTRPATIPSPPGTYTGGVTDVWGNIQIARDQSLTEQRITLYHEWVHSVLSPKLGPLRSLRARVAISGYLRSAILKATEEALAQSYGELRVNGIWAAIKSVDFPIRNGYVTVSQLAAEGMALGTIVVGGVTFHVSLHLGTMRTAGDR